MWCKSTCISPTTFRSMSIKLWCEKISSIWLKNPIPVLILVDVTPDGQKTGSGFYEPTNPNDVRILKTIPDRKYVEVGTVIVSICDEGGDVTIMHNDIRTESAVLGADAVILTDEGVEYVELEGTKYWAMGVAVKFE